MNEQGPQQLKPEDNWVRGNQLELGRRISDADPSGDMALWAQLYLGQSAIRLMKGIAEAKEVAQVMGAIIAQCELDVQRGTREMLLMADTNSQAFRDLHFDTRVSAAIIGRLNQLVERGVAASAEITEHHDGNYHHAQ